MWWCGVLLYTVTILSTAASSAVGSSDNSQAGLALNDSSVLPFYTAAFSKALVIPLDKLVRDESSMPCYFGTIRCSDGSVLCLDPATFKGCPFDTADLFSLDSIVSIMKDFFHQITDDPIKFVVSIFTGGIKDAFDDVKNCFKGLSGKPTTCGTVSTFQSCASTAVNLLTAGRLGALTGAAKTRAKAAVDKLDDAIKTTEVLCRAGCGNAQCTGPSLQSYHTPSGCTCRQFQPPSAKPGFVGVTPPNCSRNVAIFNVTTQALDHKQVFPSLGCYVGEFSNPSSYSSCHVTEISTVFQDAAFVKCVDSVGQPLALDDNGNPKLAAAVPSDSAAMGSHGASLVIQTLCLVVAFFAIP